MLDSRPLYPTLADSRRYVETGERRRVGELIRRGRNTLLMGEPGSGKTTTLRMIEFQLRNDEFPVAFISLAQARDVTHAVVALHRAAAGEDWIEDNEEARERVLRLLEDPFAPNQLIADLQNSPENAIFLVDDVTGEIGHSLFGRMRDALWQLGLTWGVAADLNEVALLTVAPADAFFESRIELLPLSVDDRRELLRKRIDPEPVDDAFEQLAITGPGNPRQLLSAARSIEDFAISPQDALLGAERRRQSAGQVAGRPAEMLVAELENLGPVSASDSRLLDRLGWTRPRAVDLLNRLEKANIVVSRRERRDGPGQPRKIYELRQVSEFAPR